MRSKLVVPSGGSGSHVHAVALLDSGGEEQAEVLGKKLLKMNFVLGMCSLCYFFRVVCLTFVLMDYERNETSTDSISLLLWFTLSLWIPTLGSVSYVR